MIDEAHGVFVSPNGSDETGLGSRAQPFATLEHGIAEAISSDRRLYACADRGVYAESVHLDAAASGIEMFGGFSGIGGEPGINDGVPGVAREVLEAN